MALTRIEPATRTIRDQKPSEKNEKRKNRKEGGAFQRQAAAMRFPDLQAAPHRARISQMVYWIRRWKAQGRISEYLMADKS